MWTLTSVYHSCIGNNSSRKIPVLIFLKITGLVTLGSLPQHFASAVLSVCSTSEPVIWFFDAMLQHLGAYIKVLPYFCLQNHCCLCSSGLLIFEDFGFEISLCCLSRYHPSPQPLYSQEC